MDIGICLGNNQGNLQIHKFTRKENTAKSLGAAFLTHAVDSCHRKHYDAASRLVKNEKIMNHARNIL